MRIDDEILLAYLDAELDEHQYEAVEAALAGEPAVRARLHALVESGERVRQAFAAKLEEPVPPRLIAAILNTPLPAAAPAEPAAPAAPRPAARARPARRRLGERLAGWLGAAGFGSGAAAFASVLLLAAGTLIGYLLLPPAEAPGPVAQPGEIIRAEGLMVALETAPSGRVLPLGEARVELMASFEDREDRVCREYGLTRSAPDAGYEIGVACREADGAWRLAFRAEDPSPPPADGYQTASDRLHEAVNDFLGGRMKGGALGADEERALIERAWTR